MRVEGKGFYHSSYKKFRWMLATDESDLAWQLFVKLFSQELEEKLNIYCTEDEGKELLNQSWIRGIRCK